MLYEGVCLYSSEGIERVFKTFKVKIMNGLIYPATLEF